MDKLERRTSSKSENISLRSHRVQGPEGRYHTGRQLESDEKFDNADTKNLRMTQTQERDGNGEEEEEEGNEEDVAKSQKNREVSKLHLCDICHRSARNSNFEESFSCSRGHFFCNVCSQRLYFRSEGGCILCEATRSHHSNSTYSHESSSQESLEGIQRLDDQFLYATDKKHCSTSWNQGSFSTASVRNANKCSTMKREETFCLRDRREDNDNCYDNVRVQSPVSMSKSKINNQISECSHRPIQCPRLDCAVNVAFSSLTHHFLFDHPEVPILIIDPGAKNTLIVNIKVLSCNSSRCLALLLVSGKLSGSAARLFSGAHINPKYRNRLPLPVLAARLNNLNATDIDKRDDQRLAGGEGNDEGNVIITWVAGLDGRNSSSPLRCSLQVVDNIDSESFRSLTYTGPVNSLRTAQKPREVFLTGDCMILHEGLLNHVTSESNNLIVNVTIH